MELGLGQKYIISSPSAGIPVLQQGGAFDLLTILAGPNVPVLVERLVLTCNFDAAGVIQLQVVKRSAAGSGGSALVVGADPTSAPAPALTANYNVATPGAIQTSYEPEWWQLFSSWEFDKKPGARLIRPGEVFAIALANGNNNTGVTAHLWAEVTEVK